MAFLLGHSLILSTALVLQTEATGEDQARDVSIAEVLLQLDDPDERVRLSAIASLAKMRVKALPGLCEALKNSDGDIRKRALVLLLDLTLCAAICHDILEFLRGTPLVARTLGCAGVTAGHTPWSVPMLIGGMKFVGGLRAGTRVMR
jgi:hypothetical protein